MDPETQHSLDLACMKFFKQTNDTALLCCLSDALLLYSNPVNQDFSWKKKESLLPTDHLVYVNSHYLTLNPILGFDGKPLAVSEGSLAVTVFVPDNFPLAKENLQKELQSLATMRYYFPEDQYLYGSEKAAAMEHEPVPVRLVYYPAGQQAFLYRPTESVHIHEAITDPLLWVVTSENTDPASQTFYLTNNGYLPRIPAGETAAEGLRPALASSGLLPYVNRCLAYSAMQKDTLRSLAPVVGCQTALFAAFTFLFLCAYTQVLRRSKYDYKLCLLLPVLGILVYHLFFPFSRIGLLVNGVMAALPFLWSIFRYSHPNISKDMPIQNNSL